MYTSRRRVQRKHEKEQVSSKNCPEEVRSHQHSQNTIVNPHELWKVVIQFWEKEDHLQLQKGLFVFGEYSHGEL